MRIEIETALRLGVAIIPLLSENATMPPAARLPASLRPLATINALPVRSDPDFHRDMERVIAAVERLMAGAPTRAQPAITPLTPLPITPPRPQPTAPSASQPAQVGFAAAKPLDAGLPAGRASSPSIAPPIAPPAKRRVKLPAWLLGAAALLVIAIAAAPLATHALPLPFLAAGPTPTTTASATAGPHLLFQPYTATHLCPCAPTSEQYTTARPHYWSWPTTFDSVSCIGGVAHLISASNNIGYLTFSGREPGFPPTFTATWTVSFHSAGLSSCLALFLVGGGASTNPGVGLCDNGAWTTEQTSGTITKASSYKLAQVVKANTVSIAINGHIVLGQTVYGESISSLTLRGGIAEGASLDVTAFSLVPDA